MPRRRSSGQPVSEASGRTSRGLNMRDPEQRGHRAAAHQAGRGVGVVDPPEQAGADRPMPPSMSSTAIAVKIRPRVLLSGSSASSSAAIGDTRVARRAGVSAAASVTSMPTTRARITVRGSITVPVLGRSAPMLLKSALSAPATPIPATTPATEPTSPMIAASSTIPRRICPRVAPSVRSIPSSRMRCATVIENVLKMRKLPTSSATPPKTRRTTRRKLRSSLMSCDWRWAACAPVSTVRRAGRTPLMRRESWPGETPSAACTEIASNSPTFPVKRCASGSVRTEVPEPPEAVVAQALDARDLVRLHAGFAGDPQRVPQLQALAVGGGLVDRRLVRRLGRAALACR